MQLGLETATSQQLQKGQAVVTEITVALFQTTSTLTMMSTSLVCMKLQAVTLSDTTPLAPPT